MTPTHVHDYNEVLAVFRARADEIGLSMTMLDEMTGLPSGYSGKVFGPSRVKLAGMFAFFLYAEVLAFKVTLVPDLEMAQRMEGRFDRRDELRRRPGVVRRPISPEMLKKVASELGRQAGAKPKQFRLSKDQRIKINTRNGKKGGRPRKNGPPPSVKSRSGASRPGCRAAHTSPAV